MNHRNFIPYTKPSITPLEVSFAQDATLNGWGENCYDYIHRFEHEFKDYLGVNYAISTSSCTGALHLGLAALEIGPGDEVILADTNWVASVTPIVHLGATPIFVDILPGTWCLDPQEVEKAITPRTKAIVAVHLYGNLCDMDRLLNISKRYKIPVVEDAAEAIGSKYKGSLAGSIGEFGVFSFHGSKTLTTGEGGMFVTNDESLFENVLTLSNLGRVRGQVKQFWPEKIGYKFKMSNVQAAIGCAQLSRVHELVDRKRQILQLYRERLSQLPGLQMNQLDVPEENTYIGAWMPTAVFPQGSFVTQKLLIHNFARENIDARVFFSPLSSLPMFNDVASNLVSWDLPNRSINLPSFHDISEKQIDKICEVLFKTATEANKGVF